MTSGMYEIISKKRDGQELEREEIAFVISGYVKGEIPDYQVAAWLMAIYIRGLSERELADLTEIMLDSGDRIPLDAVPGKKIDKHSTGGVGDKISFVVAPLVAACGVRVPMLSGRGLGHTGGTLDKLEAIPGMNVFLTTEKFREVLASTGMVICGQTDNIVPADKKIYALRDATATVSCIPLIASSIMSKKLALGSDGIVLDVKTGSGAFMKDERDSIRLCQTMVAIGAKTRRPTLGIISSMDQPLGRAVGNSLEMIESIEALKGNGPADVMEVTFALGYCMLLAAGQETAYPQAIEKFKEAIVSGRALDVFRRFIAAQGGDPRVCDDYSLLPASSQQTEFLAPVAGHRLLRRGHGRHRHRRRPAQERGRHRLRQRLRLPRQRRRQGRKRPEAGDRPLRPTATAPGGHGTAGRRHPLQPPTRRQAQDGPAPHRQGRRPHLALLSAVKKEYKSIFFDADDTLFDYLRAERAALLACWSEFRIPVEPEIFIHAYRRHNHDVWREFERGEIDQKTLRVERFRRLAAEFAIPGLPLDDISSFYLEALSEQPHLLPGALSLVRKLAKRYPLALVTNGIASVQNKRFAASPITPYFKSIVISEVVGIAKPDPRIFHPALQKIGVTSAEVLYVGDSITSDMAAARNAGMDFCWINPNGAPVPAGHAPAHIIPSLMEFLDLPGI
jgi:pyrimidine-nucleoside phosphorylase